MGDFQFPMATKIILKMFGYGCSIWRRLLLLANKLLLKDALYVFIKDSNNIKPLFKEEKMITYLFKYYYY